MKKKDLLLCLTFPRTATHYIWGNLIASKKYQMLWDLDILPALFILKKYYNQKIDFLDTNNHKWFGKLKIIPKYNFQYDSLYNFNSIYESCNIHINRLYKKYNSKNNYNDLLKKVFMSNDLSSENVLVINRFVYNCSYKFLFNKNNFVWSNTQNLESLILFNDSLSNYFNIKIICIIKEINDFLSSRIQYYEKEEYIKSIKTLINSNLKIDFFDTNKVIKYLKKSKNFQFWKELEAINYKDIKNKYLNYNKNLVKSNRKMKILHLKGIINFALEKNYFTQQSLIHSLGWLPLTDKRYYIPKLGNYIDECLKKDKLNNAKLKILH